MSRRTIRRWTSLLTVAAAAWAVVLFVSGGLDATLLGVRVTSNDPFRPLVLAAISFLVYIRAGGRLTPPEGAAGDYWRRVVAAVASPHRLAATLALAVVFTGWFYGTKAVGGADTYGYLSQSDRWADGTLKISQPFAGDVPWPRGNWTFVPVGSYRPLDTFHKVPDEDRWTMVPVYPPGLPMLLAAAGAIGGFQAKFLVVPLLAGLLVMATYGIGVRLASPTAALIGAWLVATSPALLFIMLGLMSDAAVSGVWAASFYLLLGRGIPSAAGAGALVSLAVLIRPNLAPLVAVMGLVYVLRLFDRRRRAGAVAEAIAFVVSAMPGILALAAINDYLYGSALASGYGTTDGMFSPDHVPQNVPRYLSWLIETHTPLVLVGLAAALVPLRRVWPAADPPSTLVVMALAVAVIWITYLLFLPWDVWWYLRFVLPSFPFIMVGVGAVAARLIGWRPAVLTPVVAVVVLMGLFQFRAAAGRGVFELWMNDRRYVTAAQMTREMTDRGSLIFTGVHVGSVRYYGSRMSAYFNYFPEDWLDRAVSWLARRGVRPYLLLEDWEVPEFKARFEGQQTLRILESPPLAIYEDPGRMFLFDLLQTEAPLGPPRTWTGVDDSVWATPPAPAPRFGFER